MSVCCFASEARNRHGCTWVWTCYCLKCRPAQQGSSSGKELCMFMEAKSNMVIASRGKVVSCPVTDALAQVVSLLALG